VIGLSLGEAMRSLVPEGSGEEHVALTESYKANFFRARLEGRSRPPFRYWHAGELATIGRREDLRQLLLIAGADERLDLRADHFLEARPHHLGEPPVAVQDGALVRQRDRALEHLLDEHAVGLLRAFEAEDLVAVRAGHDQRVDLAVADRGQRLLGLAQAVAEFLKLDDGSGGLVHVALRLFLLGGRRRSGRRAPLRARRAVSRRTKVQPHQYAIGVGKIADHLLKRLRKAFDERRRRDDLLPPGQHRLLVNVDHFQFVAAVQVLIAY